MVDADSGPGMDVSAELRLEPTPRAASEARRFVSRFCAAAGINEDSCQNAALLTSEVVTNAVLHGRTEVTLRLHRPGDVIRIEVVDHNSAMPEPADRGDDASSGRGLVIVEALAARWGADPGADGKTVWFEIDA